MIDRFFVILGAGASFDAATDAFVQREGRLRGWAVRPPLVTHLFGANYFDILGRYPIAQMAAADIAPQTDSSFSIEKFIRETYKDSSHELDQRKYLSLPPYLQDLLFTCGKDFARSPDNYDRLISAALRLPDVVFVTLNYDTLLDDRLGLLGGLGTMEAYLDPGERRWSLIKLHGSVTWGREILMDDFDVRLPGPVIELSDQIELRRFADLEDVRRERDQGVRRFYPALSVPVGEDDELVCPDSHVDFLREKLADSNGLHLLVIGYSANDREVLRLIKDSGQEIASLMVVNNGQDGTERAMIKLRDDLGIDPGCVSTNLDGFGRFTFAGLPDYMDRLNGLRS